MPMEHGNEADVNNLKRGRDESILFNALRVILDSPLLPQHSWPPRYFSVLSTIWMFPATLEHYRHTTASCHCDLGSRTGTIRASPESEAISWHRFPNSNYGELAYSSFWW